MSHILINLSETNSSSIKKVEGTRETPMNICLTCLSNFTYVLKRLMIKNQNSLIINWKIKKECNTKVDHVFKICVTHLEVPGTE